MKIVFILSVILISLAQVIGNPTESNLRDSENNTFLMPINSGTWEITVKPSTSFTVKIRGNPTTGYGWYLENAKELDHNVIKPTNLDKYHSAEYISDPNPERLMGVPGFYYFKFIAKEAVNSPAKLIFIEKRPWESNAIGRVETRVTISKK